MEAQAEQAAPVEAAETTETQAPAEAPAGGTAGPAGTSPAEQTVKKFKLKGDNGKEVELDEAGLIQRAQRGIGAEKAMREAAELRKREAGYQALLKKLKDDPFEVLSDPSLGVDARKKAEEWLYRQLEREQMPEEKREALEWKAKAESYEKQIREHAERQKQERLAQMTEASKREFETQIMAALEAAPNLPRTERTVGRVAHYLNEGMKRGLKLTVAQVMPLVQEDYEAETRQLAQNLTPDQLVKLLGDDAVKKLSEYRVAQIKNPAPVSAPTGAQPEKPPRKAGESFSDYFERIRR